MTQNVLEDDRAALKFRQAQKSLKAVGNDVCFGQRRRFQVIGQGNESLAGFAAQKIQAGVSSNAKEPAFKIVHSGSLGSRAHGLHKSVLQDILTIDGRAGHAGTETMKAGSHRPQAILEFVRIHGPLALPRWEVRDGAAISIRIFARAAGWDRKGE